VKKHWTPEEIDYLESKWGNRSIAGLAKTLGRTVQSVDQKARRLGLGPSKSGGELVNISNLATAIGVNFHTVKRWVDACGLKARRIKSVKNTSHKVELPVFWKWAESNKQRLNFANFEPLALGIEPGWVDEKRKADQKDPSKALNKRKWTDDEDAVLIAQAKSGRYTYQEMSESFKRSEKAIQKRLFVLGVPYRPRPADIRSWSECELSHLKDLKNKGYSDVAAAKVIGRGQLSLTNKVKAMGLR